MVRPKKRINILGRWNNIGNPVVSYYTEEQLMSMVSSLDGGKLMTSEKREREVNLLWKCAFIRSRADMTIIVQRSES